MKKIIFICIVGLATFAFARPSTVTRPYGEAHFRAIVMAKKEVQEPGLTNCYVTLRITGLKQSSEKPIARIKRGDIVTNVLDTPLCDLQPGYQARGILIDNGADFKNKRSLMIETF